MGQQFRGFRGDFQQAICQPGDFASGSVPRARAMARAKTASTVSCAVNALVLATLISGPAMVSSMASAGPRDAAFRHVDDGEDVLPLRPHIAQSRQRIGGLAGLAEQQAKPTAGKGGVR